jgi:predicted NBD/HSP70 family sugar kinase
VIVIGGGVIAAGDLLLDPARRELAARALRPMNRTPVVPPSSGPTRDDRRRGDGADRAGAGGG